MKRNEFFKLMLNPFSRVAGWPALLAGVCVMVLTIVVGYYGGLVFDGVVDVHAVPSDEIGSLTWSKAFLYPVISQILFIALCALVALVFTRNFRVLDLAGTLTLARAPQLLCALAGLGASMPSAQAIAANPLAVFQNAGLIVFAIVSCVAVVWTIVWMVYAVRVSCDLKSGKLAGVFIMSIFVAEVLAKLILTHLPL